MYKLSKFTINPYKEEPLEGFELFSFENSLESAQKRIPNAIWQSYHAQLLDKISKKYIVTEPIIWGYKNFLIRKI